MTAPAIVLVCDYSLAYLGGAQVAFIREVEAVRGAGRPVVVVAPAASATFADDDPELTIIEPRVRFTIPGLGLPVLDPVDTLTSLMTDVLTGTSVQGVVVHSEFALAVAALRAARSAGIPTAHVVHTFFWRAPRALAALAPLVRRLHQRLTGIGSSAPRCSGGHAIDDALRTMTLRVALEADTVISPSAHQAERLRAAGLRSVSVLSNVAVPAGPACDETAPLRLLWAGRFAPEKRLGVALEAMRLVRDRLGPGRVELHVAGGMKNPEHGVIFHGRVSSERVDSLLDSADAVLLTSVGYDNQPMIVLEAFAHGRPVLVCDPVLHAEFGDAVLLSGGTDAASLADAISDVARDRGRLRDAREFASAYAAGRTPGAHVRGLLDILRGARTGSLAG